MAFNNTVDITCSLNYLCRNVKAAKHDMSSMMQYLDRVHDVMGQFEEHLWAHVEQYEALAQVWTGVDGVWAGGGGRGQARAIGVGAGGAGGGGRGRAGAGEGGRGRARAACPGVPRCFQVRTCAWGAPPPPPPPTPRIHQPHTI